MSVYVDTKMYMALRGMIPFKHDGVSTMPREEVIRRLQIIVNQIAQGQNKWALATASSLLAELEKARTDH